MLKQISKIETTFGELTSIPAKTWVKGFKLSNLESLLKYKIINERFGVFDQKLEVEVESAELHDKTFHDETVRIDIGLIDENVVFDNGFGESELWKAKIGLNTKHFDIEAVIPTNEILSEDIVGMEKVADMIKKALEKNEYVRKKFIEATLEVMKEDLINRSAPGSFLEYEVLLDPQISIKKSLGENNGHDSDYSSGDELDLAIDYLNKDPDHRCFFWLHLYDFKGVLRIKTAGKGESKFVAVEALISETMKEINNAIIQNKLADVQEEAKKLERKLR